MGVAERRARRDEKTLYAMARIFCSAHHKTTDGGAESRKNGQARHQDSVYQGVCPECAATIAYSIERTARCPHDHKGNCEDCDIHCYKPEERARIREIMAYAGPRMLTKHPILTFFYLKKKFVKQC